MPVTKMTPSWAAYMPRNSDPREPMIPSASPTPASWSNSPSAPIPVPTVKVRTVLIAIGMSIATAVTSTAEPTVAFGLNRMIRNAPS